MYAPVQRAPRHRIAHLGPGEQIPFTVAWRTHDGDPAVVDYGAGSLPVPG